MPNIGLEPSAPRMRRAAAQAARSADETRGLTNGTTESTEYRYGMLMTEKRHPQDSPTAIAKLGWRYHHLGIPHTGPRAGERYLDHLGVHICGFESSPYGIEWMRFEPHCQVPAIVKTTPHLAFAVDNLDEALEGKDVLIAPNAPSPGVRVAFIVHDGAPVELLEFMDPSLPKVAENNAAEQAAAADGRRP